MQQGQGQTRSHSRGQRELSDMEHPNASLPLRWRTCATRCGKSRWGSPRWRSTVSERVSRKSWSTDPPPWSSSEEREQRSSGFTSRGHLYESQDHTRDAIFYTHNAQVPRARRRVQTEQEPGDGDHVVLNKWLSEHREGRWETSERSQAANNRYKLHS